MNENSLQRLNPLIPCIVDIQTLVREGPEFDTDLISMVAALRVPLRSSIQAPSRPRCGLVTLVGTGVADADYKWD